MLHQILISALAIVVFACSPATENRGWKRIDKPAWSIEYPPKWEHAPEAPVGSVFIVYAPLEPGGTAFRDNINLVVEDISGMGIGLDAYVAVSEEQISSLIEGPKILASERKQGANGPYHEIAYTGYFGQAELTWRQHYYVVGNWAFVLTFTATKQSFENRLAEAERMMASFRIKAAN